MLTWMSCVLVTRLRWDANRKKEKSLFEGIGMWNGAKNQFGF